MHELSLYILCNLIKQKSLPFFVFGFHFLVYLVSVRRHQHHKDANGGQVNNENGQQGHQQQKSQGNGVAE